MLEQLAQWIERLEPYTSYRIVLSFVLGAITLYTVAEALISLRSFLIILRNLDAMAQEKRVFDYARIALDPSFGPSSQTTIKSKPGSLLRHLVIMATLKAFDRKTLRLCWRELALIGVLLSACIAAYIYIYST